MPSYQNSVDRRTIGPSTLRPQRKISQFSVFYSFCRFHHSGLSIFVVFVSAHYRLYVLCVKLSCPLVKFEMLSYPNSADGQIYLLNIPQMSKELTILTFQCDRCVSIFAIFIGGLQNGRSVRFLPQQKLKSTTTYVEILSY